MRAAVGASLTRSPTTPSGAAHFDAETIVFADATYDFRELVAFHGRLAPLIARLQITQTDIDEVSNTVYIGVRTPEAVSTARAALLDLGVPSDAVHVAVAGPIVLTANVGDEVRPVPGGVMILDNAASPGACTVGFNVTRNEWWGTQYGFLTASHCTKFSGRTSDATDFFQNGRSWCHGIGCDKIGDELLDPSWASCQNQEDGTSFLCRTADVAYVYHDGHHKAAPYRIAGVADGRRDFTTLVEVAGEYGPEKMLVNSVVYRIGHVTGRHWGTLVRSCVNQWDYPLGYRAPELGARYGLLCQFGVTGGVLPEPGDSGGPVFVDDGSGRVWASGIQVAKEVSANIWYFSSNNRIHAEVGPYRACASCPMQ